MLIRLTDKLAINPKHVITVEVNIQNEIYITLLNDLEVSFKLNENEAFKDIVKKLNK